jgi:hypothetical protein
VSPLATVPRHHHFIGMRERVQSIRELIRTARALRSAAHVEVEQPYIEKLLRIAAELEEHAQLLADMRPDESIVLPDEEALHAPVDILI